MAQTGHILTTVSVLTVRTDGLGAVNATVTDIALTAASDSVAATVTRASIGTHLHLTGLTHESTSTEARAIHTSSVR